MGEDANDAKNDTPRTRALFLSYLIFSGGRIPLKGIEVGEAWFRPDVWVIGALVKKGRLAVDEEAGVFVVTQQGWKFIAETLEKLAASKANEI